MTIKTKTNSREDLCVKHLSILQIGGNFLLELTSKSMVKTIILWLKVPIRRSTCSKESHSSGGVRIKFSHFVNPTKDNQD